MKQVWLIFCIISNLLSPLAGASTDGLSALNGKLSFPPSVTTPPPPAGTGTNNKWAAIGNVHFRLPSLQRSTVCVKPACPPSVAFHTTTVARNGLLSAFALRVLSSVGGNSLLAHGIVTSLWFFATPVHGGWAGKCANGYLGATCSTSDCCWGYYDPSSNTCGSTHTFVCNGTPNGNKIGCGACCGDYTCDSIDSSTVIGPWSCRGKDSCYKLQTSTIGIQACVGDEACKLAESITVGYNSCNENGACASNSKVTIGDNSCNGQDACQSAVNTIFGSNSCNSSGQKVCWDCINSNVPSNECNNIPDGYTNKDTCYWYEYNYCIYCSNCQDEATGQSCYVSVLSASVQARRAIIPRRLKAKKTSSVSNNENDMDCNELKETITNFFKTVKDDALKKLIGKYIKSETKKNKKNPNLCMITFDIMFEHLNEEELERTCNALQTVFTEHVEEFKNTNPGFTDLTFSCEPKDQNANNGKDPKESKKGGKKKRKRIPKHSTAVLVAQSDGA